MRPEHKALACTWGGTASLRCGSECCQKTHHSELSHSQAPSGPFARHYCCSA
ncbi:hypothetical protein M3J09_001825 [Ascochyta lentis]